MEKKCKYCRKPLSDFKLKYGGKYCDTKCFNNSFKKVKRVIKTKKNIKNQGLVCSSNNCERESKIKGLCKKHYDNLWKN